MEKYNLTRLKRCIRDAKAGKELTIGFLGGSITQGCNATVHENTYSYRVFSWWKETFPQAEFHYVNGGIGGTTSHYGVSRAVTDVLMYQPDFVVVDFSVNDEPDKFFQETYEGVVRRLLSWNSKPAVILLNNVYYDTGINAQEYHNQIGDWYQVPHVSIKDTVYKRMKQGEYTRDELTEDGLHPNDKGHGLVADEIIKLLEETVKNMEDEKDTGEQADPYEIMKEPVTANAYENAKRLTIREVSPKLDGFRTDTEEKTGLLDHFKNGWIGKKCGDKISFEIDASCIAVQYRKTINKPSLVAKLVLDGDNDNAVTLDANFEEDWGDCLYIEPVLHHGEKKLHKVEIEILETKEKVVTPFYLMSLIIDK